MGELSFNYIQLIPLIDFVGFGLWAGRHHTIQPTKERDWIQLNKTKVKKRGLACLRWGKFDWGKENELELMKELN